MALSVRRTGEVLSQLLAALEQMRCEIAFRHTPLPELMQLLAAESHGAVADFFRNTSKELMRREAASAGVAFRMCLPPAPVFPPQARQTILQLGSSLGRYDIKSQLRGVDLAIERTRNQLDKWRSEQRSLIRSYCTLGICAGMAIAILAF